MAGNRISFITRSRSLFPPPPYRIINFNNYTYDPGELNLLTTVGSVNEITYDKWGNMSQGVRHKYTFNESNQLTQVNYGSAILGQYWYSAEGKRYKKVENNKTTYYIYSGENLLYEVRDDCTICYVYQNGKPVARVENGPLGQKTYYYHTDLQGTTRVVTDSSKYPVERYDYDAFGTPNTDISNESVAYTTKGQDATGLYYFNARYYDPTLVYQ